MGEFNLFNPMRPKNNEKLYDDYFAHGITRVSSFGVIPPKDQVDFVWKRPFTWEV